LPVPALSFKVSFTTDSAQVILSMITGETQVYLARVEDLLALAKSRVMRSLTTGACQQYLHVEQCPVTEP
jgi:hypothetical protein